MTSFCSTCEEFVVLSPGSVCPVCDPRPVRPVVVPPLALDRRSPSPATVVDEQAGGAS